MRIAKTTLDIIITGKLIDTETVMISLEGGGWKSASNGNSLATYPTVRPVRSGEGREIILPLDLTRPHHPFASSPLSTKICSIVYYNT
ncbi:MAG: hypothetical protein PUP93_30000 [Rhizonema sp. NSF051]|nr:hypothetical protein [Rhizonema sp. NSF051]